MSTRQKLPTAKLSSGVKDIPVSRIAVGDIVIIKSGEVVPIDGEVVSGKSSFDEAALTGESLPVDKAKFSKVLSGSTNVGNTIEIKALATSRESQYQKIINLVKQATQSKAPFVRLADRYSIPFTIISFILAGVAWAYSGEAIRFLAVLVVATPCPLLIATPIALVSGVSRAARRGVIMKNGGSLEQLGSIKTLVVDKTGTVTIGEPELTRVRVYDMKQSHVVKIAASFEQLSSHILARSIVRFAKAHKE